MSNGSGSASFLFAGFSVSTVSSATAASSPPPASGATRDAMPGSLSSGAGARHGPLAGSDCTLVLLVSNGPAGILVAKASRRMSPERGPQRGSDRREHAGAAAASRGVVGDLLHSPVYRLLIATPLLIAFEHLRPDAHTALFLFSIVAIVPLAALLSHATEGVAAPTG